MFSNFYDGLSRYTIFLAIGICGYQVGKCQPTPPQTSPPHPKTTTNNNEKEKEEETVLLLLELAVFVWREHPSDKKHKQTKKYTRSPN